MSCNNCSSGLTLTVNFSFPCQSPFSLLSYFFCLSSGLKISVLFSCPCQYICFLWSAVSSAWVLARRWFLFSCQSLLPLLSCFFSLSPSWHNIGELLQLMSLWLNYSDFPSLSNDDQTILITVGIYVINLYFYLFAEQIYTSTLSFHELYTNGTVL